MPPPVQSGLLRVLEYHEVLPLGGKQSDIRNVDVRFIAATNADMESMAAAGTFREDLFDRLRQGGVLLLPPLRERPDDIPVLVEGLVRAAEAETPNSRRHQVEPETMKRLKSHPWPGNIRELRNCIFTAVQNHRDVEHLFPDHLDLTVARQPQLDNIASWRPPVNISERSDSLRDFADLLQNFKFDKATQFAGKLPAVEEAWARFMGRLLRAALEATRKPTLENPEGQIYIQPAVKLLTGNEDLKAWQAYDMVKRIVQISPSVTEELILDPILLGVIEKATKSRKRK
jgi:DNA-binding NtrC family response regulator